ncbi:MAG TPA: hypothetical protein VF773_10190 [Verrucomicrobiae bacterium]
MATYGEIAVLRVFLSAALLYVFLIPSHSAAPANDNFANATQLTGSSVSITSSLRGATFENGESPSPMHWDGTSSVWFSWIAPATSRILVVPRATAGGGTLSISTGATLAATQEVSNLLVDIPVLGGDYPTRYAYFDAQSDVEYRIRVAGQQATDFSLLLSNTRSPFIIEHPRSKTSSPGANAFFSVFAASDPQQPLSLQWQHNNTDLPGRTGPTLAFTNVTAELAGEYRAVLSVPNSTGAFLSLTSSIAHLSVKVAPAPILTLRRETNSLVIDFQGDTGRNYILRGLTDVYPNGYFVLVSTDAFPLRLPNRPNSHSEFVYLQVREPNNNICDLNLRRILFEKYQVAQRQNLGPGAAFLIDDIITVIGEEPQCPDGGIYTYGAIGTDPVCSLAAAPLFHTLW